MRAVHCGETAASEPPLDAPDSDVLPRKVFLMIRVLEKRLQHAGPHPGEMLVEGAVRGFGGLEQRQYPPLQRRIVLAAVGEQGFALAPFKVEGITEYFVNQLTACRVQLAPDCIACSK